LSTAVSAGVLKVDMLLEPMMLIFNALFSLSVHAMRGAAVFAPAKRMLLLAEISVSELNVYWSSFWPVTGLREVTRSLEPPSIDEWREM